MFGTTFGHGTLKKYVIFFGTLFNNIYLNRYNTAGTLVQNMRVPLNYGPREKFLARAEGNSNLERPIAVQLPRMSFEMTNLYYDSTRKMQSLNKLTAVNPDDPNSKLYQYAPVPYNIEFHLSIMVKNAEDGTFIIEQILPYFKPDWTATLNLNPDLNLKYDVPLVLENISSEDTYEGDFVQRRAIIWTLNFTMKGWLFGPTKSNGGNIIKEIDLNFLIPPARVTVEDATRTNTSEIESLQITPGQTANGAPVSWYGDIDADSRPATVSANTVVEDTEWGYMIDFTDNS